MNKNKYIDIELLHPFNTTFTPPASKSILCRAILMATLKTNSSNKVIKLKNVTLCDDVLTMINACVKLGATICYEQTSLKISRTKYTEGGEIDAKDSAICARFLLSILCYLKGTWILTGSERLCERPLLELYISLKKWGADLTCLKKEGFLPLRIRHNPEFKIPASITLLGESSSQFGSSILIASHYFSASTADISFTNLSSASYFNMSKQMLSDFSINHEYSIEPDFSAITYFAAAAIITHSSLQLLKTPSKSIQGEINFLNLIKCMGATVEFNKGWQISRSEHTPLKALDVNMNDCCDSVPTMAVLALFTEGTTIIRGVAHLRIKESDRLKALKNELEKTGAQVEELEDGLKIKPPHKIMGATFETYNDHRMAMALSLIGLKIPNVRIADPNCVSKSFPSFWDEIKQLKNRAKDKIFLPNPP